MFGSGVKQDPRRASCKLRCEIDDVFSIGTRVAILDSASLVQLDHTTFERRWL